MKKKLFTILLGVLSLILFSACFSCQGLIIQKPIEYYTVTFIQDGQENIVKEVEKGKALTDIPEPISIPGYNVTWSIADFSKIKSDLTVTIIKEAKTFKVHYSLGILEGYEKVSIVEYDKDVFYNTYFSLTTPSCEGYEFLGWVLDESDNYFYGGTYTYLTDITVTAKWKLVDEDLGWSGLH